MEETYGLVKYKWIVVGCWNYGTKCCNMLVQIDGFEHKYQNKLIENLEQIGRFGFLKHKRCTSAWEASCSFYIG